MDYTVCVDQPSEQVRSRLVDLLQQHHLQVTTSFDLRLARAGQVSCDCPHHGQAECTCQYAILLIYEPGQLDRFYRTITIHGRDDTVWLTLLQTPCPPTSNTLTHEAVEAILLHALLSLVTPSSQVATIEASEAVALKS